MLSARRNVGNACARQRGGSAPLADVSDGEHDAQGGEHNVPESELRCVEEIAGEDAHDVLPGALVLVHSLADGPASSLGRTREPIHGRARAYTLA